MRVLLTNNSLAIRGGTDLYIRDVALELLRRGHEPVVYSTHLGDVAQEIREATVPVIKSIGMLGEAPDVIHAQHQYDTLTAMLRFPDTPVVSFCHGWVPWEEAPLCFPQIVRYVAVSEVCRERLIAEGGVSAKRTHLIHNFFNRDLFPPRGPLPERPQRALCLSNAMTAPALSILRHACEHAGIAFDVRGLAAGQSERDPGSLLAEYDVVFGRGRTAIEGLAVGAAVILCDELHLGPVATRANFAVLRSQNFGRRALLNPLTRDGVLEQLSRYNPREATATAHMARAQCEMRPAVDRILAVYAQAIAEFRTMPAIDPAQRTSALIGFLEDAAPFYKFSILAEERRKWMLAEEHHQQALAYEREQHAQAPHT